MARSLNEIQQPILDDIATSDALNALQVLTTTEQTLTSATSTSKVAVWRLFVYIIAVTTQTLEKILDVFKATVIAIVAANRPHDAEWYKSKALAFQYGDTLVDKDEYEVIDAAKQIIKQVACMEGDRTIVIKIATATGDELIKLPDPNQVNAFITYMNKVKDAGTVIEVTNADADLLKVTMDFYYDALIVDSAGMEINTGINVVETAIKSYLKSLDFNGEFDINKMIDYLQKAKGYASLKINFCGFKAGLATSYSIITRNYLPLSGYMKLDLSELQVNYFPNV
jgi:hypothetical protein